MLVINLIHCFIVWVLLFLIKSSIAYNTSNNCVLISGSATGNEFASALSDLDDINNDFNADFSMSVSTNFILVRSSCSIINKFVRINNFEVFQNCSKVIVQNLKMIGADQTGKSRSGSGNFNNDVINDIIIDARYTSPNSNKVYLVFEKASTLNGIMDLAQFNSNTGVVIHETDYFYNDSTGFKILRETVNNRIGLFLHSAGEANQNGVRDWINGVLNAKPLDFSNAPFCYLTEHRVVNCIKIKDFTPLLQNRLGSETQPSCSMLDNSTPEIIITLQSNKNHTYFSFCPTILIISIIILCDWLRNVQSDNSTGGACSSSALEILKRREKNRYVFQHYPSYFIDVSYILYSHYVNIVF